MGADDRIGSHDTVLDIGKVHRPPFALAQAVGTPEELSEAGRQGCTAGESVGVTPVSSQGEIVRTEGCRETYRNRLLSNA
jgi:hypothetical protein